MECKVWNVECGVPKCGSKVWRVNCGVWSVKCGMCGVFGV